MLDTETRLSHLQLIVHPDLSALSQDGRIQKSLRAGTPREESARGCAGKAAEVALLAATARGETLMSRRVVFTFFSAATRLLAAAKGVLGCFCTSSLATVVGLASVSLGSDGDFSSCSASEVDLCQAVVRPTDSACPLSVALAAALPAVEHASICAIGAAEGLAFGEASGCMLHPRDGSAVFKLVRTCLPAEGVAVSSERSRRSTSYDGGSDENLTVHC